MRDNVEGTDAPVLVITGLNVETLRDAFARGYCVTGLEAVLNGDPSYTCKKLKGNSSDSKGNPSDSKRSIRSDFSLGAQAAFFEAGYVGVDISVIKQDPDGQEKCWLDLVKRIP